MKKERSTAIVIGTLGGLSCDSHDLKDLEVYERYKEGDRIPKDHYLWTPMKMIFYSEDEEK